jgi:NADPH:quinone reductase-like Zn-dependent oxidoreductase
MKAAMINNYGNSDVFKVTECDKPEIKTDEVLVKVHASSTNPLDSKIRSGALKMMISKKFPKILGHDLAGEVEEVGSDVRNIKKGDRVFGVNAFASDGGGFAEYAAIKEDYIAVLPAEISFNEGAVLPQVGIAAVQALRDLGNVKEGTRVLINGGAGGVGSISIQVAKILGAEVTAVGSAQSQALMKKLGADITFDYKKSDFTKEKVKYDVVFDAVAKQSFGACKKVLKKKGVFISTNPSFAVIVSFLTTKIFSRKKVSILMAKPSSEDLDWIAKQVLENKITTIIDKTFSLDEIVDADKYSETGRTKGKNVIIIK